VQVLSFRLTKSLMRRWSPEGIEIQSDEEIEIKDSVTYTIILNDVERKKLRAVQEKIWREGIDAEMSIDAVVEKVVTATLEFLTVKVLDEPLARMTVVRRETWFANGSRRSDINIANKFRPKSGYSTPSFSEGCVGGAAVTLTPLTKVKQRLNPPVPLEKLVGKSCLAYGFHALENDGRRDFRWSRRFFGLYLEDAPLREIALLINAEHESTLAISVEGIPLEVRAVSRGDQIVALHPPRKPQRQTAL
jgi:hypothetical protein